MKTGNKKSLIIVAVVAVLIVIAIGLFTILNPKDGLGKAYRDIKVYEITGSANVDRNDVGSIDAYEGMQLMNEDLLTVMEQSSLYLQMDEDKYGMLSSNSIMKLEAAGNSVDSKTKLYLEEGTFTCHIKNKLSENSSFEVNTPNSTMAIRGTSFRVEVWRDENGDVYTKLTVFEGVIEVRLVYPDGKIDTESVFVRKGDEIIIHMNDLISEYLTEYEGKGYGENDIDGIDYDDIERDELIFIYGFDGEDIYSIPRDELEDLIYSAEVIFTYQGNLFGSQRVRFGETVQVPSMQPAATGEWDYDFSVPVEGDIEIAWKN